jgi:hypothetical protein
MFVELVCTCGASMQFEQSNNEDALWLLTNRFVESHTSCGFVNKLQSDSPDKTERYDLKFKRRPRLDAGYEEDEDD